MYNHGLESDIFFVTDVHDEIRYFLLHQMLIKNDQAKPTVTVYSRARRMLTTAGPKGG
jgi:hypothetical protein